MIRNFIFYLAYWYFLLIIKTSRVKITGENILQEQWRQGKSLVFCCPHYFLLGLFAGVEIGKIKRPPMSLVASLSSDGEMIAKLLKKFRYDMIRGSSNRGGKKALLELARAGKEGKSLGLAFDGPKGPPLVPKRGLIGCAKAAKGTLVLIHGRALAGKWTPFFKPFRVNSWDRFLVPTPFCQFELHFEKVPPPPFAEPKNTEQEDKNEEFILGYIEGRSKEVAGPIIPRRVRKRK